MIWTTTLTMAIGKSGEGELISSLCWLVTPLDWAMCGSFLICAMKMVEVRYLKVVIILNMFYRRKCIAISLNDTIMRPAAPCNSFANIQNHFENVNNVLMIIILKGLYNCAIIENLAIPTRSHKSYYIFYIWRPKRLVPFNQEILAMLIDAVNVLNCWDFANQLHFNHHEKFSVHIWKKSIDFWYNLALSQYHRTG